MSVPVLIILGAEANVFMFDIRRNDQLNPYMVVAQNDCSKWEIASLRPSCPLIVLIRSTAAWYVFRSAEKRAEIKAPLVSWLLNKSSRCSGLKSASLSRI